MVIAVSITMLTKSIALALFISIAGYKDMYSQSQATISKSLIGISLLLRTTPLPSDNFFPKQITTTQNAKLVLSEDARYIDLIVEQTDTDHFINRKFLVSKESQQDYTIEVSTQNLSGELEGLRLSGIQSTLNNLQFKSKENMYILTPYLQSKGFKKTIYDEVKHQYFFSSESPNKVKYLTRRDQSKKHLFHIDPQVPSRLVEIIESGVLYWNKYFSKRILEVKVAPASLSPYTPGINYIKWMNDPSTRGLAHNTIDINTGEIIQSLIYLNSKMLNLKVHMGQEFIPHTDDLDIKDKIIHNSLRYIVAHEIGHALGLKHNFAGNLHKHNHSVSPSSTVMEYLSVSDRVLMGESIAENHYLHEYDSFTVDHLYNTPEQESISDELFCTDKDNESKVYIDCRQFDSGNNIVNSFLKVFQDRMLSIPLIFYEFNKGNEISIKKSKGLRDTTYKLINTIASSLRKTLYLPSSGTALLTENMPREQMKLLRSKKIFQVLHRHLNETFLSKKWELQLQKVNATKKVKEKFQNYSKGLMTRIRRQMLYALTNHTFFEIYASSHHMEVFLKDFIERIISDTAQAFTTKSKAISLLRNINGLSSESKYIHKLESQINSDQSLPSDSKKILMARMRSII